MFKEVVTFQRGVFDLVAGQQPLGQVGVLSRDAYWVGPDHRLERIIGEVLGSVAAVRHVFIQPELGGGMMVWTLLGAYDRDARESVYGRELELCERLHANDFDFRVSSVDTISPESLRHGGALEVFRR